ncbi:Hypothetical predicted protein [Mytilus galloprovincialis]|uniref:Uncharacterized protein n=1 Tax=Mytilus galloprovincialis TaxID=29158 RepID=A0A8B6C3E6_MYTGA|nr:Hypothetical predicted protein [Mytilus galloprovincialis]
MYTNTGDSSPIKLRPYRLPIHKRDDVDRQVQNMLKQGLISPSNNPYSFPIILTMKPDNSDRFVIDYRQFNAVTKGDSYPIARIDDSLYALSGSVFMSTVIWLAVTGKPRYTHIVERKLLSVRAKVFEHEEYKSVEGSQDSQGASTIQGTPSSQVTDSQTSDWFHDQLTARDKFNQAMHTISKEFTPLRSQLSHDWDIIERRTKNYYLSKAVESINIVVSYIAPGQEDKILPDVCLKLAPANYIEKDTLIDERIVAYIASNHSDIQIQILSIFANKYTKEELKKLVPGLTISKIDRARKHATLCGPGDVVKKEEIHRDRLTRAKIAHFLDFLSSPAYCQIVGFGSKIIKLSNGAEIKIPKVVRTVMASRVIQLYDIFCKSTDFSSLRRSSLYKIVKLCASSQKTSLQGLANTIADGMKGIDTLERIVRKLNTFGLDTTSTKEVTLFLYRTNQHLKFDIKGHTAFQSDVVNHCSTYALSDNKENDFYGECQHEHDNSCSVCSAVLQCESKVTDLYKEIQDNIPSEQKEEIEHDLEMSGKQITAWHSHCIRTVHQDKAKQDILSNLKPNEVLVIMDLAMKFIPFLHREKQADFLGKKGMSWHFACAVTKPKDQLELKCFIHILDDGVQGWFTVANILSDVMVALKKQNPMLTCTFLKSDNAGCYHCGSLLAFIQAQNLKGAPIQIKQYNFSEAQSGKDLCDSKTSHSKLHILRYADEGHDVTSPFDMKQALESYGGLRGHSHQLFLSINIWNLKCP